MLTKLVKRRFPPTPERLARPLYRLWRGVATFATLIVVVASAVAAYFLEQHDKGIPVVGKIEPGLSHMAFPSWKALGLPTHAVMTQAVPLAMLGKGLGGLSVCISTHTFPSPTAFMETYSVGRKFAEENKLELDQVRPG